MRRTNEKRKQISQVDGESVEIGASRCDRQSYFRCTGGIHRALTRNINKENETALLLSQVLPVISRLSDSANQTLLAELHFTKLVKHFQITHTVSQFTAAIFSTVQ